MKKPGIFLFIILILKTTITETTEDNSLNEEANKIEIIENTIPLEEVSNPTVENSDVPSENIWTNLKEEPKEIEVLGNELIQLRTYKRISTDIDRYVEKYKSCLKILTDNNFNEKTINECLGRNFKKFVNDIDYEVKKILARIEMRIKYLMVEKCYNKLNHEVEKLKYCELLEVDVLDLMWRNLNFYDTIHAHKKKYLYSDGELPPEIYKDVRLELKKIYDNLSEIYDEIIDHKRISLYKLKQYLNNRTNIILERKKKFIDNKTPMYVKRKIRIDESVLDNSNNYNIRALPHEVIMDVSPHAFSHQQNQNVKQLLYSHPDFVKENEDKFDYDGPVIEFP